MLTPEGSRRMFFNDAMNLLEGVALSDMEKTNAFLPVFDLRYHLENQKRELEAYRDDPARVWHCKEHAERDIGIRDFAALLAPMKAVPDKYHCGVYFREHTIEGIEVEHIVAELSASADGPFRGVNINFIPYTQFKFYPSRVEGEVPIVLEYRAPLSIGRAVLGAILFAQDYRNMKKAFDDRKVVEGPRNIVKNVSPVNEMKERATKMWQRGTGRYGYNLVKFNCECFMHWIMMNTWICIQSGYCFNRTWVPEMNIEEYMNTEEDLETVAIEDLRLGEEDFLFQFGDPERLSRGTWTGISVLLAKLEAERYNWKRCETRWRDTVRIYDSHGQILDLGTDIVPQYDWAVEAWRTVPGGDDTVISFPLSIYVVR